MGPALVALPDRAGLGHEVAEQLIDLRRRHDAVDVELLDRQRRPLPGPEGDRRLGQGLGRRRLSQIPEAPVAGRVRHQMHARDVRAVVDLVDPPVVEDPGLPRGHVHHLPVAVEAHVRRRHDRHMQPHPVKPVIVDVRVLGHRRSRPQPHQPRAAPHHAEVAEHLLDVGRGLQMRRRRHGPGHVVVLGATDRDQAQGAVAGDIVRVLGPGAVGEGLDLTPQLVHVEAEGQLDEGTGQFHAISRAL